MLAVAIMLIEITRIKETIKYENFEEQKEITHLDDNKFCILIFLPLLEIRS